MAGRASRSEYWWFVLFTVLCYVPGAYLTYMLEFPVVLFVWLGLVLPTLSVLVRRLHDTNRSGAWWFVCLVPFGAVVLVVFLCRGGDPEANDYGLPVGSSTTGRRRAVAEPGRRPRWSPGQPIARVSPGAAAGGPERRTPGCPTGGGRSGPWSSRWRWPAVPGRG
ncbi:DUF805 domain-containing protein [Streptomyces sp. M19]